MRLRGFACINKWTADNTHRNSSMALTRLDNLISSKTGKYLYVSPDDFNASDELNNRGNSPV